MDGYIDRVRLVMEREFRYFQVLRTDDDAVTRAALASIRPGTGSRFPPRLAAPATTSAPRQSLRSATRSGGASRSNCSGGERFLETANASPVAQDDHGTLWATDI